MVSVPYLTELGFSFEERFIFVLYGTVWLILNMLFIMQGDKLIKFWWLNSECFYDELKMNFFSRSSQNDGLQSE